MAKRSGNAIQLEWFNVTYRSVLSVVGLAVIVLGGAVGYWYWFHIHTPRAGAAEAIAGAEGKYAEAASLESPDPRLVEVVQSARIALREARDAFSAMSFDDARGAAIRSENLSGQAIGMVRGSGEGAQMVRFFRLEGEVRVKKAGEFSWEQANPRMELQLGDQVKTSSSASAQLIYFDGTITTIQPGSLLEIRELYENPVTKVRRVREELTFGELQASTQKKNVEGSFHEVATGDVAARSVDEAEFRVKAEANSKQASFDVFNGQIEVAASGRRENVAAGERIRTTADGKLTGKEMLPGVPALVSPRDQKVFIFDDPAQSEITLTWEQVPGAHAYHLTIADKMLFTNPLYDARRESTNAVLTDVPEGSFHWRVAAIGSNDVSGPFSSARRFRVTSQKIRDRTDTEPPVLEITEFVPIGLMVIVNGRTEPGATLWIDNEKIDVYDDGTFYAVVRLRKEGLNNLRFVAQDTAGNEQELARTAYVEVY